MTADAMPHRLQGIESLPALAERAAAQRYAAAARAPSTQRAYAANWRRFAAWCHARQTSSLPAYPRAVAVFLAAEAAAGLAPSPSADA